MYDQSWIFIEFRTMKKFIFFEVLRSSFDRKHQETHWSLKKHGKTLWEHPGLSNNMNFGHQKEMSGNSLAFRTICT